MIVGDRTIFIPTIEAELRQIEGVADCGVVALPTGPGEIRLSCLAVVQGADTAGTHAAVVARLRAETPTIEVVCGDSVPKTPSGKIDRLALKARLQDV